MIFVTVGTTKFQFDRLLKQVDFNWGEDLIIQKGQSEYKFKNAGLAKKYFNYDEMIKFFKQARIVIIHAGVGSYLMARRYFSGAPIVVPRLKKYGEHVSDHQLMLAEYLEHNKVATVIRDTSLLYGKIKNYQELIRTQSIAGSNATNELLVYLRNVC